MPGIPRRIAALALLALGLGLGLVACDQPPSEATEPPAATEPADEPGGEDDPSGGVAPTGEGEEADLPLPSSLPLAEYESQLFDFLESGRYHEMGWAVDKRVRDTGPYVDDQYYGTHPAVRIYYSPAVYDWLQADRAGELPDGSMIIKEMFPAPAARYASMTDEEVTDQLGMWTYMVRDASATKDGWFWGYHGRGDPTDDHDYPYAYPDSGFGQYCVRCHASADDHFTFSSLVNIAGEEGNPISYVDDGSWRVEKELPNYTHEEQAEDPVPPTPPAPFVNEAFLERFDTLPPVSPDEVQKMPPLTYDHVIAGPEGPGQFLTSDQCMSCHDGMGEPFGPNMFIPGEGGTRDANLSPYGEWSWSMMGLAGRDPIFYAQLESEITMHDQGELPETIQNICFRCHGVMGQRQYHLDEAGEFFTQDLVQVADPEDPMHAYGALARDGISCMVCHQITDEGKPIQDTMTGRFDLSPAGAAGDGNSLVFGPFEDPRVLAMESSLGIVPAYSEHVTESRLCGHCHTIYLPVFDDEGEQVGEDFEQSTYLEWLNSAYQDEFGEGSDVQSCQDCHMPGTFEGEELAFRIANIQDQTYPEAEHRAPEAQTDIPIREGFRRHSLQGINLFGLEMFQQFDEILGVRLTDYMTGSDDGLPMAIENGDLLAKEETAVLTIEALAYEDDALLVDLDVRSLVGHRFPSGVGFRRAFLELLVRDASGEVVWASGATDDVGFILDGEGEPLPSERHAFLDPEACEATPEDETGDAEACAQAWQPHYELIDAEDQVQIYEELVQDPQGRFTTSFVAQETTVKDNRLLPKGWTPEGPEGFAEDPTWGPRFQLATSPKGGALEDETFLDGAAHDTIRYRIERPVQELLGGRVEARLLYQAIPPPYLNDRFTIADGPNTQRLYALASHLSTEGTPIEGWKLEVASAEERIELE